MGTLFILLLLCGAGLIAVTGVCVVLLDPIIAILIIYGIYKLVSSVFKKKNG